MRATMKVIASEPETRPILRVLSGDEHTEAIAAWLEANGDRLCDELFAPKPFTLGRLPKKKQYFRVDELEGGTASRATE